MRLRKTGNVVICAVLLLRDILFLPVKEDDLTTGGLKRKWNMDQPVQPLTDPGLIRRMHEEEDEPASSRPNDFAADGSRRHRFVAKVRLLTGVERDRAWATVVAHWPNYQIAQDRAEPRRFRLFLLTPAPDRPF